MLATGLVTCDDVELDLGSTASQSLTYRREDTRYLWLFCGRRASAVACAGHTAAVVRDGAVKLSSGTRA